MSIDEFIEIVAPKLKHDLVKDSFFMSGKELKLTGYGYGPNAAKIEDDLVYEIPMPSVRPVNHKRKLRLAYLRGGKPAVRTYLRKYLSEEAVEKIIQVL